MSKLRPELTSGGTEKYCPEHGTALLMTLNAVKTKRGLAHGQLHKCGESCAVGSYFDVNPNCYFPGGLTDEVAAVNDSMPNATPRARKVMVMRWLRWKLSLLKMPGFENAAKPKP